LQSHSLEYKKWNRIVLEIKEGMVKENKRRKSKKEKTLKEVEIVRISI